MFQDIIPTHQSPEYVEAIVRHPTSSSTYHSTDIITA